mgnify:CR=1 FL=1
MYEHDKEQIAESKGKPDYPVRGLDNTVLALSKPQYAALHKFFTTFDVKKFTLLQPRRKEAVGSWISERFFLEEMVRYLPKVADVAATYGDGVREKEELDKKIAYLRALETTPVGALGSALDTSQAKIECGKRKRPLNIAALAQKPFLRKEEVAVINKIYDAAQNAFGVTAGNTPAHVGTLVERAQDLFACRGRVFYGASCIRILPLEATGLFERKPNSRVIGGGATIIDPARVQENHERVFHPESYAGTKKTYVAVSSVEGLVYAIRWLDEQGGAELGLLADAVRLNSESTYVDKRLAEQLKRRYTRAQETGGDKR